MGLGKFKGFQWDKGNDVKNWISHEVSKIETEQVFFNEPLLLYYDERHSLCEERYYVLGSTDDGRKLMIVFVEREKLIREISARDTSKKEREVYEKNTKI